MLLLVVSVLQFNKKIVVLQLHCYFRCATAKIGYRAEYCIDVFEVWAC